MATAVGPVRAWVLAGSSLTQVITVPSINFDACTPTGGLTHNEEPAEWAFTGI